jgi:hypothetical protein
MQQSNATFSKIQRQRPALSEAEMLRRQRSDKTHKPKRTDKRNPS